MVSGLMLNQGDVIRVRTGAGGGYGDPTSRSPEAVREDVRNGYLSPTQAQTIYGVAI
ncbi:hypothetical protein D9M70_640090 [compost metagenome]